MLGLSGGAAITAGLLMCEMKLEASNTKLLAVAVRASTFTLLGIMPQVVETERLTPGHAWEMRNLKALM